MLQNSLGQTFNTSPELIPKKFPAGNDPRGKPRGIKVSRNHEYSIQTLRATHSNTLSANIKVNGILAKRGHLKEQGMVSCRVLGSKQRLTVINSWHEIFSMAGKKIHKHKNNFFMDTFSRKEKPDGETLPVIIPLILYQGKEDWDSSLDLQALFNFSDAARNLFSRYLPSFQSELIYDKKGDVEFVLSSFAYALQAEEVDKDQIDDIFRVIRNPNLREKAMTIANQLEEKGIEKGIEKGTLIGRIQECQELLNQQVTNIEQLRLKSDESLEQLHDQLKEQLKNRLQ